MWVVLVCFTSASRQLHVCQRHRKDEGVFGPPARYKEVGAGQTVVIVDTGFEKHESEHYRSSPYASQVEEVALWPGREQRVPSHACKSYTIGYAHYAPRAKVVMLRFFESIYINAENQAISFLRGMRLSLEWIIANALVRNITTVQISALDGYADMQVYEQSPGGLEELWLFDNAINRLRRDFPQIWISAPTGNGERNTGNQSHDARYPGPGKLISWPARHPLIFAIGCAIFKNGQPMAVFQRTSQTQLSMATWPTSTCNTFACAFSLHIRDAMGVSQLSAHQVFEAMKLGSITFFDNESQSNQTIAMPMKAKDCIHGRRVDIRCSTQRSASLSAGVAATAS